MGVCVRPAMWLVCTGLDHYEQRATGNFNPNQNYALSRWFGIYDSCGQQAIHGLVTVNKPWVMVFGSGDVSFIMIYMPL